MGIGVVVEGDAVLEMMAEGFVFVAPTAGVGLEDADAPRGPPASTKEVFLGGGCLVDIGRGLVGNFFWDCFGFDVLTNVVVGTVFLAVVVVIVVAGIGFGFVVSVVVAAAFVVVEDAPVMALLGRLCGFNDAVVVVAWEVF